MTRLVERPIFIVGSGRSGTTLLRSLLSAHPSIAITPETHYMKRVRREGGLHRATPEDFERFWEEYVGWSRFLDLGIDPMECRRLVEVAGDRTFRGIFSAVLHGYGQRTGKERVGEKTPGHFDFIPRLLEWYPEARIIFMQRDPRAVAASRLSVPWIRLLPRPSMRRGILGDTRAYHVLFKAFRWAHAYQSVLPRWKADPRVMVVQYERLVADVEGELRGMCGFIGEEYTPAMISNRTRDTVPEPARPDRDRKEVLHHRRSRAPVSPSSVEKWKQELSPAEVAMVEAICRAGMLEAGYSLRSISRHAPIAPVLGGVGRGIVELAKGELRLRKRPVG